MKARAVRSCAPGLGVPRENPHHSHVYFDMPDPHSAVNLCITKTDYPETYGPARQLREPNFCNGLGFDYGDTTSAHRIFPLGHLRSSALWNH
jgi:hypothetical protein